MVLYPRVFKRLDISHSSSLKTHYYYLEKMAYLQHNNNTVPFVSGPLICTNDGSEEYSYWNIAQRIENSLKYYMKPYKMCVFGGDDIKNRDKPLILSRVWLNSNKDINNILILMERITFNDNTINTYKYITAINNRSWQPLNWSEVENTTNIRQTILSSNDPYPGNYKINMNLE